MCRHLVLAAAFPVAATQASANEQRSCTFNLAVFPNAAPETVSLGTIIADNGPTAHIRVDGSREWSARRSTVGATEHVTFDTGPATEVMTNSANGEDLWKVTYRDTGMAQINVSAFAGSCDPWQAK